MAKRNPNHYLGRLSQENLPTAPAPQELVITRHATAKLIGMRATIVGHDNLGRVMWFNPVKCCDEGLNPDQYVTLEGECEIRSPSPHKEKR